MFTYALNACLSVYDRRENEADLNYFPYDIWSITHAATNMLGKTRSAKTLVPRNPYINDTVSGDRGTPSARRAVPQATNTILAFKIHNEHY